MVKELNAAEGKWLPNKYVISILVFLVIGTCTLTWKIAEAYYSVKQEQAVSNEKQKTISSEVIDLKVTVKDAIVDMTKVVNNNNTLISELIETIKNDTGSSGIKKTQPVAFKKAIFEGDSSVN